MAKQQPVKGKKRGKKRVMRKVPSGIAHIKASFNNTIVTITDPAGKTIAWASGGKLRFVGSRKSSGFAATLIAQDAGKIAKAHGMEEVEVLINGPGAGRESAVRGLQAAGLSVTAIRDRTPVPHNGCRARKRRRV